MCHTHTHLCTHGAVVTHLPRKSSEESVSKSHTCRMRMAGSFCSVLSREKICSLFFTTTTCERRMIMSEEGSWGHHCGPWASSGLYLFSRHVAEGEHKAPVEVSFSSQRVVVYIGLLSVIFQSFQPASEKGKTAGIFSEITSM